MDLSSVLTCPPTATTDTLILPSVTVNPPVIVASPKFTPRSGRKGYGALGRFDSNKINKRVTTNHSISASRRVTRSVSRVFEVAPLKNMDVSESLETPATACDNSKGPEAANTEATESSSSSEPTSSTDVPCSETFTETTELSTETQGSSTENPADTETPESTETLESTTKALEDSSEKPTPTSENGVPKRRSKRLILQEIDTTPKSPGRRCSPRHLELQPGKSVLKLAAPTLPDTDIPSTQSTEGTKTDDLSSSVHPPPKEITTDSSAAIGFYSKQDLVAREKAAAAAAIENARKRPRLLRKSRKPKNEKPESKKLAPAPVGDKKRVVWATNLEW